MNLSRARNIPGYGDLSGRWIPLAFGAFERMRCWHTASGWHLGNPASVGARSLTLTRR